jgi:hypothetical protein
MNQMPNQITIGPHTYTINTNQNDINAENVKENAEHLGLTDTTKTTIYITLNQAPTQIQDTLLHETLHACFDLIAAKEDIDHDTEEKLVRRLAPTLLQTLQQNPQLVTYLTNQHY